MNSRTALYFRWMRSGTFSAGSISCRNGLKISRNMHWTKQRSTVFVILDGSWSRAAATGSIRTEMPFRRRWSRLDLWKTRS
ncbi:hypothetical protein D3C71_1888940 [compost metagenome]